MTEGDRERGIKYFVEGQNTLSGKARATIQYVCVLEPKAIRKD